MTTLILLAGFLIAASAVPVPEYKVDVTQNSHGYYKLILKTATYTREEERQPDGEISGTFTYVDSNGVTQTVHYSGGVKGFLAKGTTLPVEDKGPVQDTPEVAKARDEHFKIVESISSLLPPSKDDGTVEEKPEAELSQTEFLDALATALNPTIPLVFINDTPEISDAKKELYNAYTAALGQ